MFYYIDQTTKEIYRAHLTPSSISTSYPQKLSIENNTYEINPTSISIDWISQNLYITDASHNCIWITKNDGRYTTKLLTNIESPWVITVNPILGIMYFINYEHETISNSNNERIVAIESAHVSHKMACFSLMISTY